MKRILSNKWKTVGLLSLIATFPSWGQDGIINTLQGIKVVGKLEDKFFLNLTDVEKAGLLKVVATNPSIRSIPIESTDDYLLLKHIGRNIKPSPIVDSQIKAEFLKNVEGINLEGHDPSEILRLLGEKVGTKLNLRDLGVTSARFVDGGGRTEGTNN